VWLAAGARRRRGAVLVRRCLPWRRNIAVLMISLIWIWTSHRIASDAVAVAVPLPQTEPSDGPLKALDLFSPACLPACHCLALALALCLPVPRPPLLALALALCLLLRASN
jgi:hypothetical protein